MDGVRVLNVVQFLEELMIEKEGSKEGPED